MVAPGGVARGACVVAPGGGMRGCSGGHVWLLRGHAWLLPGGACMVAPRGACVVALGGHVWLLQGSMRGCSGGCAWLLPGGMCGCSQGVCMVARGHAWLLLGGVHGCSWGGMHGIRQDTEIRSMSGWYASYWNAFLLFVTHCNENFKTNSLTFLEVCYIFLLTFKDYFPDIKKIKMCQNIMEQTPTER